MSTSMPAEPEVMPPAAKKVDHREERHGATVVDPYFWLREKSNPEVIQYLEAENAYTAAMSKDVQPFADKLYQEMLGRIKQTDLSVPYRRGSYLYYSRTEEGKQYPITCRKGAEAGAAEQVLLDMNELAKGLKFFSVGRTHVSEDAQRLAYTTDTTGFRQYTLYVKDLKAGTTSAALAERVTSVEWAADNKTLFYVTEDPVTKRSDRLFRRGADGTVQELYNEKDELYRIGISKTRDNQYLFLSIHSTDTTEVRYLRADQPAGSFAMFVAREKKHRYDLDHREGLFYIRSNKGAKNFQILTTPVGKTGPENWKVFSPHRVDGLTMDFDLFKNFAVVLEKREAVTGFRVYDFRSGEWHGLSFPEPVYSAFPSTNAEYDASAYRYTYESMVTPSSVFDYDMEGRKSTLLKQQEVLGGYDPKQYESERLWATARDGKKVPISIVYKKGFQRDGKGPLYLYAYGSYGFGMPAGFSSARLSLLDRGMAYAIAHIRGGDEMGEAWHEDGMLMNKKNTFFDFIDCAEYLIREKWTTKDRLAIEGRSAGGLLMGAVINYRPDLFRAAHVGVPFVDVMNTMMDASLPLTVGEYLEWGNPNERAAYDYMKSYSPYDNLERRGYPAMLVTTSLNDSQVMYWEPAKYVARLRTLKTDKNPLLLKINMGAGHGGASGRYDRLREMAWEYAWMMGEVGVGR